MTTTKPARNNISNTPNRIILTVMLDLEKGYDPDDVVDELSVDDHPAVSYYEILDMETFVMPDRGE
tara:strand:- start:755 stop:952 length:198 start_codon:yes stop_codon:yes gene_type:complete